MSQKKLASFCCSLVLLQAFATAVFAEVPAVLTDKIRGGSGSIDLLKNVSSTELEQYLNSGTMFLGVDLNENAGGNESADSIGVAIKSVELQITTNAGVLSFTSFYTNTSAMIQEAGSSQASNYKTLFGSIGSNELTGSSGFDLSSFDDIIEIRNINVDSSILAANLKVNFLNTTQTGENETFFDFSGGYEELALLGQSDAQILESAAIGISTAPETITYSGGSSTESSSTSNTTTENAYSYNNAIQSSGAPEPYWFILLILPALIWWRNKPGENLSQ